MKKKYSRPLDEFLKDMLNIAYSKGFPGFFYRSRAHVMVILLICKANIANEEMGFEDICNIIPKFITSRSTIKSILDTGSNLSYFQKITSKIDKRKKIFLPSKDVDNFMLKWILRNEEIFRNI